MKMQELVVLVEAMQKEMARMEEEFKARLATGAEEFKALHDQYNELAEVVAGMGETLERVAGKVEARNSSAPIKRNMTKDDAEKVLLDKDGKDHKEMAEELGLTYAQVYSCRLGFTFKDVHRKLEKSGWTTKWARG